MKSFMNALYRYMYRLADGIAIVMLGVMVFSVFTNVIFRFFPYGLPLGR
jgi:TRAP-type C4-dicarboxylate transport system permease small subunit